MAPVESQGARAGEETGPCRRRLTAQGREEEQCKGAWSAELVPQGLQGDEGLAPEGHCNPQCAILGGEVGVGAFLAGVKM